MFDQIRSIDKQRIIKIFDDFPKTKLKKSSRLLKKHLWINNLKYSGNNLTEK